MDNRAIVMLLLAIIMSMNLIPLTRVPVLQTVIAPLNHDTATDTGVNELVGFLPGAVVIDPFSFLGRLFLMRAVIDVVWVCHGTPEGLDTQNGLVEWTDFREFMDLTSAARQYVMACHSAELLECFPELEGIVPRSSVVDGAIDAGLLAGWTAMHILLAHSNLPAAQAVLSASLESALERASNNELLPLGLGSNELFWAIVGAAFLVVSLLAGSGMAWALQEETIRAIGAMLAVGYLENFINIVALLIGWLSGAVSLLAFLASVLPIVPALIYYIIISTAWYNLWKVGVLGASASVPWVTMISNIALAFTIAALLLGILSDFIDSDDQATTFFG